MLWKLKHKLFGWDYIQWKNSADQGVARVWIDGLDRACYWRYRSTRVADIIRTPDQVIWLTCRPEKYIGPAPAKDATHD